MKTIVLLLLLTNCFISSHAQYVDKENGCTYLQFNHLKEGIGTEYITVNRIFEDRAGFIWLSTETGICRFDGSQMVYFPHSGNRSVHGLYQVNAFCQDHQQRIWMGTETGLCYYLPQQDDIISVVFRKEGDQEGVTAIAEAGDYLWVVTVKGLYYSPVSTATSSEHWQFFPLSDTKDFNAITTLYSSDKGDLWIGTSNGKVGLLTADQIQKHDFHIQLKYAFPDNVHGIVALTAHPEGYLLMANSNQMALLDQHGIVTPFFKNETIQSVSVTSRGEIWCATFGNGLFYFPSLHEKPTNYLSTPNNYTTYNYINHSFIDSHDNLWIIPEKLGLRWLSSHARTVKNYTHQVGNNSLAHNVVKGIAVDHDSNWYMGTYNGLSIFHPSSSTFEHLSLSAFSHLSNQIEATTFDHQGTLWLGTRSGLFRYMPKNRYLKAIPALKHTFIWEIYPSRDQSGLWLATQNGVCYYNLTDGQIISYNQKNGIPEGPAAGQPICIFEDLQKQLWVGTEKGGLYRATIGKDLHALQFKHYCNESHKGGFCSNNANAIYETPDHTLWIGTKVGLFSYNAKDQMFHHYTQPDGLANLIIKGILADQQHLWMITHQGITSLNLTSGKTKNYNTQDGISGNIFNLSACSMTPQGQLLAGCLTGLVALDITTLNQEQPPFHEPYIASITVNNTILRKDTPFNGRMVCDMACDNIKKLSLNYNENNLAVEVGTVELNHPERIRWAYRIPQITEEWHYLPAGQHTLTYNNLSKGDYTLEYRCTNANGEWNDSMGALAISIQPHWSQSTLAYLIYAIASVGLITLFLQIRERKIKEKEDLEHEREMHQQTVALEQEKLDFFTNISHELRTPITLIAAPLEELRNHKDQLSAEQQNYYLDLIHKNTHLLSKLMNQLLHFRKIQNGKEQLHLQIHSIPTLVHRIVEAFSNYAVSQQQTLTLELSDDAAKLSDVVCDADVIEKILCNLISNALKYTPQGGTITIGIDHISTDRFCLFVRDNGIGIATELQQQIFERFQRLPNAASKATGVGIGLAYVKALVELHQGEIIVDSQQGKGSCFRVYLPSKLTIDDNISSNLSSDTYITDALTSPAAVNLPFDTNPKLQKTPNEEKETLLIVEDNADLRNFIAHLFRDQLNVITAKNGEEGLEMARQQLPDIIITDIMMPKMNGVKMTNELKSNWETSYIPVIMLTAKAETEHEIEGLTAGGDYYLRKPFHPQQLELTVQNIHKHQHEMYQHLKEELQKLTTKVIPPTKDYKERIAPDIKNNPFLQEVDTYIQSHLSSPELTVEHLAANVGVSSMQLYRKIKAATGMTPNDYLRQHRMQRAIELLAQDQLNVSEIAYSIGYSDPKYFSKCFKAIYGVSPSHFNKQ